jgi:hypothetical protein
METVTKKNLIIGFSLGVTARLIEPYSQANVNILARCGANAMEINLHHVENIGLLTNIFPLPETIHYLSFHAPGNVRYGDNSKTRQLLTEIESKYHKYNIKLIVVHPDLVDDWQVFNDFKVNWAIENMDDRKDSYQDLLSLESFFADHPSWKLVLDLGHCNANDKSMALADQIIGKLGDRISEIHLSGYRKFHDPLYRSNQPEIIDYCNKLDVPIIIESMFDQGDGLNGVNKELEYIKNRLSLLKTKE